MSGAAELSERRSLSFQRFSCGLSSTQRNRDQIRREVLLLKKVPDIYTLNHVVPAQDPRRPPTAHESHSRHGVKATARRRGQKSRPLRPAPNGMSYRGLGHHLRTRRRYGPSGLRRVRRELAFGCQGTGTRQPPRHRTCIISKHLFPYKCSF